MTLEEKYEWIVNKLIEKDITISTMESCTAGYIASMLTDTEGSSTVFPGGYVTYSNETKIKAGVDRKVIDQYGVYSMETAIGMAQTVRNSMLTDIGIGITGSFGNVDPNNGDSIPGEVYYAFDVRGNVQTFHDSIPTLENRHAYKRYMAESIVDSLILLFQTK